MTNEMKWMPIDSAPKDGSLILLARKKTEDEPAISVPGFWEEGESDAPDVIGYDDGFVDINYQIFTGGRSWGVEAFRWASKQPTHWMPLPPPPEA